MSRLKLHRGMTNERWGAQPRTKRILMIANELKRAGHCIGTGDAKALRECYDRGYELLSLEIPLARGTAGLKELLRFKEMLGELYLAAPPAASRNRAMLRALLLLDAGAYNLAGGDAPAG